MVGSMGGAIINSGYFDDYYVVAVLSLSFAFDSTAALL
jgi:hypothetical protein